jgi:hypothetical protein
MATLTEIVRREVRWYASSGEGANIRLFPLLDDEHKTYGVIDVLYPYTEPNSAEVIVMARIFGDKVIIEADNTDKPLYKRLMDRHDVPRDRIILAYAGESTEKYFERLPLPGYFDEPLTEEKEELATDS